jgi:hypothetical protein
MAALFLYRNVETMIAPSPGDCAAVTLPSARAFTENR